MYEFWLSFSVVTASLLCDNKAIDLHRAWSDLAILFHHSFTYFLYLECNTFRKCGHHNGPLKKSHNTENCMHMKCVGSLNYISSVSRLVHTTAKKWEEERGSGRGEGRERRGGGGVERGGSSLTL